MKKIALILSAVITSVMLLNIVSVSAADISIVVNGEDLHTDTPAVIVNDRTLVPLRAVSEALGCDVAWDADTRGITLTDGDYLYLMWIDRDCIFKLSAVSLEGHSILDAAPVIMNDYTMVPLRAISEMFGATVNWDSASYTVSVSYPMVSGNSGLAEKYMSYEQAMYLQYDTYKDYAMGTCNTINAQIELENGGIIDLELYPDIAPIAVQNFVTLANAHFYDGLIFHRVISGFMVQGGGFDTSMQQKTSSEITGEFLANGYFNLIPHKRGVLSMARTAVSNDSASSQFFIMHADYPSLDGQYAAFGKVTSGMEYVDQIASVQTASVSGMDDVPTQQQVIKSITIK